MTVLNALRWQSVDDRKRKLLTVQRHVKMNDFDKNKIECLSSIKNYQRGSPLQYLL